MRRLVEVKFRPLIYNALCVVTQAVIKKNIMCKNVLINSINNNIIAIVL